MPLLFVVSWSGCRLLLRVSGCCSCSPVVGGRVSGSRRAVGCFPGRSSLCRLVVSWSGCCCPHVGRFSVVLSHLVGVSVASDGVPIRREGVAVALQVSGVLLMLSDWLPIGCASCRGVGCSCSPDVGRVSRSSCRDRLPLLFVVSWSGCCSCSPDVGRTSRSSCRDRLPLLFVVSRSGGVGRVPRMLLQDRRPIGRRPTQQCGGRSRALLSAPFLTFKSCHFGLQNFGNYEQ